MSIPLHDYPSAHTAAVVTIAALGGDTNEGGGTIVLDRIDFSLSGSGTAPSATSPVNLKVESPSGTIIWQRDIIGMISDQHIFPAGLPGAKGQAVIVTLADGGANVTGKLDVLQR